jgi:hypothetical protein
LEIAFWEVTAQLSRQAQPYDVLFFADDKLRDDLPTFEQLQRYRMLVLPQCSYLTPNQADALLHYVHSGGQIVAIAPLGANVPEETRRAITDHAGTLLHHTTASALAAGLPGDAQVAINQPADLGVHIQRLRDGSAAVHIVNYAYDHANDAAITANGVELAIRLPHIYASATVYVPGAEPRAVEVQTDGDVHRVQLDHVSVYTIVLLHDERVLPAE